MAATTTKLQEEIALYQERRADFVRDHADEYVLIKNSDVIGFYPTEHDALRAGYNHFGNVPFLVRKVAESETPIFLTSLNLHIVR